ncbi:helix-turn-helix domain-containing protein [Acetatifactor muris]|uniref:HTH-type transcriptional regulator SinR n=1 Tax=Acetatifactor muris TaxID=879566 RepID=A0A2K4ZMN3_9FIRM|nr:helix-turn-helix transcriptional regulator [Acetatifactor muris]MCR2049999.1 helix-turn-helix domain-containing protein [Acetatifactor muris]SOY31652.1 HTH-type transcriptional regulator SinR [Acetatifactor muris]
MNFGESIKQIRKEKGLTQKQLGEKLGISQSAIGQFESNKANPKMETIQKIADALNVSLNDLVPDSFEQTIQIGREVSASDYSTIEAMANHNIFTDKEREKLFEKIEHYRNILATMDDRDKLIEYSSKTHTELENTLLKMLMKKSEYDTANAIIVLSCFLSLKGNDQQSIIEMLLEYCYPHKDLKYWGTTTDTPPQS